MNETLSLSYRISILSIVLLSWLILYFAVNRRSVEVSRRMDTAIALDHKLPFIPQFAIIYFSTYIFVFQPFFILSDSDIFYWMVASFSIISVGSTLIHAIFPSKIERMEDVSTQKLSGKMLALFQKTCKPYGNFPSMHVGLSVPVVAVNYMTGNLFSGTTILIWGILIALSTLYTKQHYILDVLIGILYGSTILAITYFLIM